MFVLPLGLGTRWPKMPVVTIAITLLLAGFFLFEKGHVRTSEKSYEYLSDRYYRIAKERLFLDYCSARKENPSTCADVKKMVAPDYESILAPNKKSKSKKPKKSRSDGDELAPDVEKHYLLVYSKFNQEIQKPSAGFKKLQNYSSFVKVEQIFKKRTAALFRKEHILSRDNVKPDSVLMAQMRHGSVNHLLGNLLCFIAFGIYVEQRMGALKFLLAYLATGTAGLVINSLYFLPPDLPLLGASANISGIMGLFYVFFFHARMRFFLWFGLSRRLWAPVKFAFPLVFIVSDLTGALQSLVPGSGPGSVAHFAHLGGLVAGMLIAVIFQLLSPVPAPFLYESELAHFEQLRNDPNLDGKIKKAETILGYNIDNALVRGTVLGAILSRRAALQSEQPNSAHKFVMNHLDNQCIDAIRLNKLDVATSIVQAVPLHLPLDQYLGTLGQTHHLMLADSAVAQGNNYLAIRLYDAFLLRWRNTHKEASIRQSVSGVLRAIPPTIQATRGLQIYLDATPSSVFKEEFGLKIAAAQHQMERQMAFLREKEWEQERARDRDRLLAREKESGVIYESERAG